MTFLSLVFLLAFTFGWDHSLFSQSINVGTTAAAMLSTNPISIAPAIGAGILPDPQLDPMSGARSAHSIPSAGMDTSDLLRGGAHSLFGSRACPRRIRESSR